LPGAVAVGPRERPHRATPTARYGADRALLLLAREHPMPPSPAVPDVARVIQLAVAPVFLLSGVGVTLTVLTSRLSRIVDRARSLEGRLAAASRDEQAGLSRELAMLSRRAQLINRALSLSTTCGLLVCLVVG